MKDQIDIEVVYALPQRAVIKPLRMAQGSLVADALKAAAADADFAGIDWTSAPVGIFGRVAGKNQALKDGDRIEIYRALAQEPKLARRARAGAPKVRQ